MSAKSLLAVLACAIPMVAGAQQNTAPQQSGVQAQGNASAQGGAAVQRDATTGATSAQSSAAGGASGSVSKGDKSVGADSGTATNAVLASSLDAKKAKPGDPVTAKTTEPSTAPDHTTLPKGTKLLGHVTEAKAAGSGEGQSTLGFVFDRAVLKDGREIPINTSVRALAAAASSVDASAGDTMGHMNGAGEAAGGAATRGGGGLVGGVGGTATGALGGTVGGAGRMAGGAGGALGSTVGGSGRTLAGGAGAVGGLNSQGMLNAGSQGVFGMKDVNIAQSAAGGGSVVTSAGKNVHLESGTRMLLSVEGSATRSASTSAQ
jgi:hypothetical protein